MAAKVPIALRLPPETLGWLDGYAKSRGSSRQVVLEAAVEGFRRDTEGGVPDLPTERPVYKPKPASAPNPMSGRQARLNREMGW